MTSNKMRNKIINIGLGLLATGSSVHPLLGQTANEKPNVLIIMADEHPYFLAGCYGNKIIKTPNIDQLAQFSSCAIPNRLAFSFTVQDYRNCVLTDRKSFLQINKSPPNALALTFV